jgi:lantibiotic modifying enzyme
MGNIIASGEYPVLVDGETLLQSLPQPSVLATGLLPEPGAEYNISGLGVGHSQATEFRVPAWQRINTDAMTLRYRRAAIRQHVNLPVLGSETVNPAPYLAEVVSGFETMYRVLLARRLEFLRIVAAQWNQSVRHMLHQTRDYFSVLNESLQPRFLRDQDQRAHQIVRALESFGMDAADSHALLALDIPHAYAAPDKRGVRATILAMSEADLARQSSLIRVAWMAAVLDRYQSATAAGSTLS